jgi:voltage-gated potassium channel
MEKNTKLGNDFGVEDHIIICNWTKKSDLLVKELHDPSVEKKRPIIVITENPQDVPDFEEDETYRGIMIVKGNPSNENSLKRAGIESAATVIILADEKLDDVADTKTIMTAIAIDHITPDIHVVAEVLSSNNMPYLAYTFVNEIICLEQLTERLLAQSCLTPGVSYIFSDLLTQSSDTNEIYVEDIPTDYIGSTFQELRKAIVSIEDQDIILIGLGSTAEKNDSKGNITMDHHGKPIMEQVLIINPKAKSQSSNTKFHKDYKLRDGDKVYLIAYNKPNLTVGLA